VNWKSLARPHFTATDTLGFLCADSYEVFKQQNKGEEREINKFRLLLFLMESNDLKAR